MAIAGDTRVDVSVKSVQDLWTVLSNTKKVDSWKDLLVDVVREDRHLAFRSREMVGGTVRRLLDLIMVPGCDSPDVASRVIVAYTRFLERGPGSADERYLFEDVMDFLHLDHTVLERRAYSPYRLNYGIGCGSSIFYSAFRFVDEKLSRALVAYGLTQPSERLGYTYLDEWDRVYQYINTTNIRNWNSVRRSNMLLKNGGRMKSKKKRGFDRIPHIIHCLEAARLTLEGQVEKGQAYARIQKMYINSLTDALVSEEEVREFLALKAKSNPEAVEKMVRAFVQLFGQVTYQPRRLSDFCKCKVRGTIFQNESVTLPAAVERLPVPNSIKDFILCTPGWSSKQMQLSFDKQ